MPLVLDNPVLDAYIRGTNERRQQQQTEVQNQFQKEAGQRAEQQLQGYLKNLDAEQKHREAQLELERQQIGLQRQSHELQARQLVGQMLSQGIMKPPTEAQANSSPVGGIKIGDQVIDPRQFASPQDLINQEAQRGRVLGDVQAETAGKTTAATHSAALPFEQLKRISEHQQEMEKQLLVGQQAMERTKAEIEGHKAVAGIEGRFGLDRARLTMLGGFETPQEFSQAVLPYVLGDAQKPLGNTPRDLILRQHISANGYKEFPAKSKADLAKMAQLDPILNLQQEFINQFAPKGNLAAAKDILVSKIPTTDLNNFRARLRSAGGTMASTLDAQTGRMANQEIERVLGGLAMPGKTIGQAVQDLNFMRSRISSKALDNIMGDIPYKQQLLILKDLKRDPSLYMTTFQGKEVPRFRQDPQDGEWLVFDPSKKGYVSVDAAK